MMKKPYNLCFSGSGDKFCCQIGTWFILNDFIIPEKIIATSGGSFIATMIALDLSLNQIMIIIRDLDINKLLDYHWNQPLSLLDNKKLGLIKGNKLLNKLKEIFPYKFKDTKYDLAICCTNIDDNKLQIFGTKETPDIYIYDAIRASVSLPMIFSPHLIEGKKYVDGGLCENFYLKYFDKNEKNIIGIRCIDDPKTHKVDSLKSFIVSTIFLPIIRNEEKNIEDYQNVKILELITSTDNYDFEKLTFENLVKQIDFGKIEAEKFLRTSYFN